MERPSTANHASKRKKSSKHSVNNSQPRRNNKKPYNANWRNSRTNIPRMPRTDTNHLSTTLQEHHQLYQHNRRSSSPTRSKGLWFTPLLVLRRPSLHASLSQLRTVQEMFQQQCQVRCLSVKSG